jgi:hypothetical protein
LRQLMRVLFEGCRDAERSPVFVGLIHRLACLMTSGSDGWPIQPRKLQERGPKIQCQPKTDERPRLSSVWDN